MKWRAAHLPNPSQALHEKLDRLITAGGADVIARWQASLPDLHDRIMRRHHDVLLELCYPPPERVAAIGATPNASFHARPKRLSRGLTQALVAPLNPNMDGWQLLGGGSAGFWPEAAGTGYSEHTTMRSMLEQHLQQLARVQLLVSTFGGYDAFLRNPLDLEVKLNGGDTSRTEAEKEGEAKEGGEAASPKPRVRVPLPRLGDIPPLSLWGTKLSSCRHLYKAYQFARLANPQGHIWQHY